MSALRSNADMPQFWTWQIDALEPCLRQKSASGINLVVISSTDVQLRCAGSRGVTRVLSPKIEAELPASVHDSIELIIEQANAWSAKGYSENFVERGIELALGAAAAELRTTFTPEISAIIAAEIRQIVDAQRK